MLAASRELQYKRLVSLIETGIHFHHNIPTINLNKFLPKIRAASSSSTLVLCIPRRVEAGVFATLHILLRVWIMYIYSSSVSKKHQGINIYLSRAPMKAVETQVLKGWKKITSCDMHNTYEIQLDSVRIRVGRSVKEISSIYKSMRAHTPGCFQQGSLYFLERHDDGNIARWSNTSLYY